MDNNPDLRICDGNNNIWISATIDCADKEITWLMCPDIKFVDNSFRANQ